MSDNKASPAGKESKFWTVFDMNQRGDKARKHDVVTRVYKATDGSIANVDTQTYELWRDKPTRMPQEHALKFLCDPAFKVLKPDGVRVMPVPKPDPSKPLTQLEDDQLVVDISELSHEALVRRVMVLPGSEEMSVDAADADLVKFLTAYNRSRRGLSDHEQMLAIMVEKGEMFREQLPPDLAEKLLGRSPVLDAVRQ